MNKLRLGTKQNSELESFRTAMSVNYTPVLHVTERVECGQHLSCRLAEQKH